MHAGKGKYLAGGIAALREASRRPRTSPTRVQSARKAQIFTPAEVTLVLKGIAIDRNRHAWHLALAGLRRGEIAGQRWDDIDFEKKLIQICRTRVDIITR